MPSLSTATRETCPLRSLLPLAMLALASTACDLLTGDGTDGAGGGAEPGAWLAPTALVRQVDRPTALGQDLRSIYWADGDGTVRLVSKEGADITVLAETYAGVSDIQAAGEFVYWLDEESGRVWSYNSVDLQSQMLAIGQDGPSRLAVDDTFLYWIDELGSVKRLPRPGGYPEILAQGSPGLSDIAIDKTRVFFSHAGRDRIQAVPLLGGLTETLATNETGAASVTADEKRVYWATTSQIRALDLTDPEAETVTLASGLSSPSWLTAAGGYVYWTSAAEGTLGRVSKSGEGDVELLAADQANPGPLVIDSSAVYWANYGDADSSGSVWKLSWN